MHVPSVEELANRAKSDTEALTHLRVEEQRMMTSRRAAVAELRSRGVSYSAIATMVGISKSHVQAILR